MAPGMARHVEHVGRGGAKAIAIAVADREVDAGNAFPVGGRPDDGAAMGRLEAEIGARMVAVMMGVEDVRQVPAMLAQRRLHRFLHGGVDDGRDVGRSVMDEPDVIVLEHGYAVNIQHGATRVFGDRIRQGATLCRPAGRRHPTVARGARGNAPRPPAVVVWQ